ncbi:MAG: hypothetical protein AUK63_811 [bacterium P3]|nr:MAG: hypothetical protein AUK63_811 [bacterium P3]
MGYIWLRWYRSTQDKKKAFKNNDSLLIKMALKEKWRYPEWQKRKGARWGHPLLLPMRGYRGCGHPVATAARMVRILHFGKFFITFITEFCISFGGDEEFFGLLGEGLHQGVVADLAHNEVAELWPRTPYSQIKYSEQLAPVGLLRVEVEAVAHFNFFFSISVRGFQLLPSSSGL